MKNTASKIIIATFAKCYIHVFEGALCRKKKTNISLELSVIPEVYNNFVVLTRTPCILFHFLLLLTIHVV